MFFCLIYLVKLTTPNLIGLTMFLSALPVMCDIVPFDKSTSILKDYYALIFPTYYSGEGFAGTLIDALASGLPAIVSDWKYNKEIVQDYETGIVYPARDIGALAEKLLWIYHHQTEWNAMRYRCLKKANDYMPEEALKELELRLD